MEYISPEDFIEIRFASVLTDYDRKTICELYQPLVGYSAIAVFFTLWSEHERYLEIFSHDHLLSMMQISVGEFQKARSALEAVGLIKTYFRTENNIRYFVYELYAPKMPRDFFDDALFYGLLTKYIGEKEARRLSTYFQREEPPSGYREISSNFVEVFHPDFDDPVFRLDHSQNIKGRTTGKVKASFDFNLFFASVESKGYLKKSAFSKAQLAEIERIATLYGISEDAMSEHVLASYHPESKDERIDFYRLGDLCREETKYPFIRKSVKGKNALPSSSSAMAEKIKLMEELSAKDYLRIKQNNTVPTKPDLLLIDDLSSKLGLNNAVINALVDYVLEVKDNSLQRAYTEKIGASLAREQITTSIDAMNYLKRFTANSRKSGKSYSAVTPMAEEAEKPTPAVVPADQTEVPHDEFASILDKYKKKSEDKK